MPKLIDDQSIRGYAINPEKSFIVQAPAGSGKTELLTQRFLKLLSRVEKNPEEIIAITFTRKAAAEMRNRIISALNQAHNNQSPTLPHKKITWELAKNVLIRNQKLNWQLQKNPSRLRILTIDALSTYIIKKLPLSAQISTQLNITDYPLPYYKKAIEWVLLTLPIDTLLLHLDNRTALLEKLLIDILKKREQWLPYIIGYQNNTNELRYHMENTLKNVALNYLKKAKLFLDHNVISQLIPLAHSAGRYCVENHGNPFIAQCYKMTTLSDSLDTFPMWLGIAHLLLTQEGNWRKSVTKKEGFPPTCKMKSLMINFLNTLSSYENLRNHLHTIMLCPPLIYNNQQWEVIESLIKILPMLVAQLNIIFYRDNVVDFVELNIAALRALGDENNPTDLALHLDYKINHLLIDEFQDTSLIQFKLIERLTAGWSPNDKRTIFLVGDPMQSIYRFRNAKVGLFLKAQQQGIGHIQLTSLTLNKNFRSYQSIINWNNKNFPTIFPSQSDIYTGAIAYSPSSAVDTKSGTVRWHLTINDNGNHEADTIIKKIKEIKEIYPDDTIALLVRSRTHLNTIIEKLHNNNLTFQAIELENLSDLMEIQDIHSLTRALLHHADRIAWLALLRAPYCGLKLSDLTLIAEASKNKTIWTILKKYNLLKLSDDAQQRLQYCIPALSYAIKNIGRTSFSYTLRTLWKQLDGFNTLTETKQHINVNYYLKLIETLETKNNHLELEAINEHLQKLYTETSASADTKLHIMTIHKAKGLEFDHVLLPGLHHRASNDKESILKWLEHPNLLGNSGFILAPIKPTGEKEDSIYHYLKTIDKIKTEHEHARLLYVAATRAKKSLHLFANFIREETIKKPPKGSFLHLLYNDAKIQLHNAIEKTILDKKPNISQKLRRFTKEYLESKPKPVFKVLPLSPPLNIYPKNLTPRYIGSLIHEILEQMATTNNLHPEHWPLQLKQLGVPDTEIEASINIIKHTISRVQKDPRGQWILSNTHQEAHCEFSLSFIDNDQIKHIIIDRCFIDKGIRWIIDYKTGTPTPEEKNNYQQQLNRYAEILTQWQNLPIRLALYFPMTSEWIEWKFTNPVTFL